MVLDAALLVQPFVFIDTVEHALQNTGEADTILNKCQKSTIVIDSNITKP